MHTAYWVEAGCDPDDLPRSVPKCYAAEIEALADVIVPEEEEPYKSDYDCEWDHGRQYHMWQQRQQIRQRLLDEARRAREGA